MTSIGSALPHTAAASTTSPGTGAASSSTGSPSSTGSSSMATQQTFLQLLVAQLQNQDPTQPVQGTEFVTQLATFTNVQENLAVQQDVDAMSNQYLGYVPSGTAVVPNPSTSSTTSGTSTSGTTPTGTTSGS